jgi:hypothetical protein
MTKFKTNKKGYIRVLILATLAVPLIIFLLGYNVILASPALLLPTFIPLIIFLWIYFDTHYTLKENKLFYRSAFLRGHVDVHKINEIVKGKTTWVGIKPATATDGILIKYNIYDEIYISPADDELLIEALKKINGKIKVTA